MTPAQFNLSELEWANALLDKPAYVMPNGRSSHDVASEVKATALDRMLDQNTVNAYGQWR
jgi:hypothetical protein